MRRVRDWLGVGTQNAGVIRYQINAIASQRAHTHTHSDGHIIMSVCKINSFSIVMLHVRCSCILILKVILWHPLSDMEIKCLELPLILVMPFPFLLSVHSALGWSSHCLKASFATRSTGSPKITIRYAPTSNRLM